MIDSRRMQTRPSRENYVAKAQAYALFAQALTDDASSYLHQMQQVTDPFAVIMELVNMLVGGTAPGERVALAGDLEDFLNQILQELASV